jgi:hypothetical protein
MIDIKSLGLTDEDFMPSLEEAIRKLIKLCNHKLYPTSESLHFAFFNHLKLYQIYLIPFTYKEGKVLIKNVKTCSSDNYEEGLELTLSFNNQFINTVSGSLSVFAEPYESIPELKEITDPFIKVLKGIDPNFLVNKDDKQNHVKEFLLKQANHFTKNDLESYTTLSSQIIPHQS